MSKLYVWGVDDVTVGPGVVMTGQDWTVMTLYGADGVMTGLGAGE